MKKLSPIAMAVILVTLGLILILWPDASITGIVRLTAFGLIAAAVIGMIMHAMNKEEKRVQKHGS